MPPEVLQATSDASSKQAAILQATVDAGARLPPATATAQAEAAREAAIQAVAAQATAQAAVAKATAQAAAARAIGSVILNVPYKNQNDPDANLKRTDQGSACIAMILSAMGQQVTTNAVTTAANQQGDNGQTQSQLVNAASAFGLKMDGAQGYTLDDLKRFLDNGQPPIALVKYANLPDRVDKAATGGHYVVVVGYDDTTQRIFINDPDYFPGTSGGFRKAYSYETWMSAWGGFAPGEPFNFSLIYPTNVRLFDTVPWGKSLTGVGMGNPQPLTPNELKAIADSKVEAVKLLTLPDPVQAQQLITDVRRVRPDMFIVARLFFSVDSNNRVPFTPQDFVDFVDAGMKAYYDAGVRYFEIHNEPNLPNEGMGWNWANGAEFGNWFTQVYNLLKKRYPEAKLGYPGLSPQPNVDDFLNGSALAANSADWIGVHSYWQQPVDQPPSPMNGDNAGYYWRAKFRSRFPGTMLMITEFSNNSAATSYTEKGQQYAQYYQLLRNEPNIGAAFSAVLNWPGQDNNREGWVLEGTETEIPTTVGGLIGQPGFLDGGPAQ